MLGPRLVDSLRGKTVLITGASRGIGRQLALACASKGANVAMIARSFDAPSHAQLEGSLRDTEAQLRAQGLAREQRILSIKADVRDDAAVGRAMQEVVAECGGVDAIVANASALDVEFMPGAKQYDLVTDVNLRGTYSLLFHGLPHLEASDLSHFATISPPLTSLSTRWLVPHPVYSLSKYGMTMLALGASERIRANTLWPKKLIRTAATKRLERATGRPAFTRGLPPDRFASTMVDLIMSDTTALSALDDDILPVHGDGEDDIFV